MCLTESPDTVHDAHGHDTSEQLGRRRFLLCVGALATGAAVVATAPSVTAAARRSSVPPPPHGSRDLTHRLRKDFPTFTAVQPTDEVIADLDADGFFAKRWTIGEHTGTHIDTPGHFVEGMRLVDEIEAAELVAPLVVVDITGKAQEDPNATVHPDDLIAFEREHGQIPERALVCMYSGWAATAADPAAFLGGPAFPEFNFPGFSIEASDWLLQQRDPVGIGVDSASIDPGNSTTFDVHVEFLGADRYGIENLNNLDQVPPIGANVFVGAIPWEGGSGSPARVIATW
jgi:kynurenine formamidase